MPILLVLAVAAACMPVPRPAPPFGLDAWGSFLATAISTAIPIILSLGLSIWAIRAVRRRPEDRSSINRHYVRLRRIIGWLNLGLVVLAIFGLGWRWTVWSSVLIETRPHYVILAPYAELLVPGPYFLALMLGWIIYYPAERALGRADSWSLGAYLLFHLRQFAILILLPVGLFVTQQSLTRACPEVVASDWFQGASAGTAILLFVLMPRMLKPLLGLVPLPAGPVRSQLEATAQRLGFRCTDLLLWPTRGAVANAMVVGIVPWARYVIFTDRLLDQLSPDELDAVFGHEVGHVKHGHIPYYAGFYLLSASTATAALAWGEKQLDAMGYEIPPLVVQWATIPTLLMMAGYIILVFGMLSRRCERQADVFGCRTGSCDNPHCDGHGPDTVLIPGAKGICPTGTMSFVRALDRVAGLNGGEGMNRSKAGLITRIWAHLRAWQHGPESSRIEFLLQMRDQPELADRTDRKVRRFRWALAITLAVTLGVLGSAVGWAELWRLL